MAKRQTQAKDREITQDDIREAQRVERAELNERLEAEIVRHEKHFEWHAGAVCQSVPDYPSMALHKLRLEAIKIRDDLESLPSEQKAAIEKLSAIEFVYPDAK